MQYLKAIGIAYVATFALQYEIARTNIREHANNTKTRENER